MTLRLEINGTDFTDKWRPYESHWTRRAYMGEASGESEFVVDDDDGTIDHADFATYKVVRVWEDASGADFCMFEGRITTKRLGRGPKRDGLAMRWVITAADSNYELRGIRITDSVRPIETDRERVLAMRAAYLDGVGSTNSHARDTTDMDGTFVEAADLIDLPAETYTDTFPDEVFRRIAEMAAKTFFVFIDGDSNKHLYYAAHDDDQLVADVFIVDDSQAIDDPDNTYAPDVSDSIGLHDGLHVVTGGSVRYADDQFYEASDVAGGEADHDKWEEHWHDDFINTAGDAERFITNTVASRSNEDFTFTVTWLMRGEHAHRMQAGYITTIRINSANVPSPIDQRATQVSHQPLYPDENGEAVYRVTADFGLPRGRPFARHVRTKPGPTPPTQSADVCTRLYFSQDTPGFNPSATGVWDIDDAGPAFEEKSLNATADSTYSATAQSTASVGGSSQDVRLGEHVYELGAATAAILAAGGGTVRMQARARSRYGVGISEAAQDNISQLTLRVYESDGTPRGFAYSGHSLSSSAGSAKWAAQAVNVNRVFPPAAADNTLDAVAGCIAGDYLVVESGYRSFTVGSTGAAMYFTSSSGFDMPEDELSTSLYNSWIEICSGGESGSQTEPVGDSGEGSPGTSNVWSPIDHVHEHGILDPDDIHMHAEFQVHQMHTNSGSDPTVNDDADDGYSRGWTWNNTTTGDVYILRDSTAGAADWVAITGGGSLEDLTDVDLTSPVPVDGDVLTFDSGVTKWKPAAAAAAASTADLVFVLDGGGIAISTGVKGDLIVDFDCTITQATLLADVSGSIVVDIWKDTYANYPPVVGDSITASAKPTISSSTKAQDATLTGWTTSISAGDTLRFNVDSATTVKRVTLALKVLKT